MLLITLQGEWLHQGLTPDAPSWLCRSDKATAQNLYDFIDYYSAQ